MRTLVVGVDGSERSRDALALARCLAQPGTQLVLVYAYTADRYRAGERGASCGRALRADAEAALACLGGGIGSETIAIADGHPADALQQIADHVAASLIIIGSTHRGPLRGVLPGGTGDRLLQRGPCPVAIAPRACSGRDHGRLRSVACAFDGGHQSRVALTYAVQLTTDTDARLEVLRATDPPGLIDATLALDELGVRGPVASAPIRWKRCAASSPSSTGCWRPRARFSAEIGRGARSDLLRVDLMVLGSPGYGPWRRVLLGSVSARVIAAACPVIVVPRSAPEAGATEPATARDSQEAVV